MHLFGNHILVFHLKKKHEKGQCFFHYLQQTNIWFSEVQMYTIRNERTCVTEIKNLQSL